MGRNTRRQSVTLKVLKAERIRLALQVARLDQRIAFLKQLARARAPGRKGRRLPPPGSPYFCS
jgi:hypothetical protein